MTNQGSMELPFGISLETIKFTQTRVFINKSLLLFKFYQFTFTWLEYNHN